MAELDLRTTVEADGAYLSGLVQSYVEKQGYFLVDHDPTDVSMPTTTSIPMTKTFAPDSS